MNASRQRRVLRKPGRDGSGLIFTMVFVMIAGIVTGAMLNASVTHRKAAARAMFREKAMAAAESGLETIAQRIQSTQAMLPTTYRTNGTVDGCDWAATALKVSEFRFQIYCTGVVNGVKWRVHAARVELPSWSQYALWMHKNGVIYFIGGESFYGWVHSNDRLYFNQAGGIGPYFYDRVTSASNDYGGTTNGSYFAKGLTLNADQDTMASVDFTQLLTAAQTYGTVLTGLTYITFSGTSARVTNPRRGWTNFNLTISTNSIIYVRQGTSGAHTNADVQIGGRLNGRLTIAADADFIITNHVTYWVDPRTNASSQNALGLVAKDDIRIATNAPNNLNIFAAMLATGQASASDDGQFMVDKYNTGSPRGDLTVWGSIVQQTRGAVGTFNSSGTSTGFAKNYGYDDRFRNSAPPYYPRVSTKVDFDGWREGPG